MAERRFGLGFDTHPREVARPLFLGGVEFVNEPGLSGHSDADVVCHAIGDALLGACGLGDLGDHFPDDDPTFAGMAGLELLRQVVLIVRKAGFAPWSCDATVIAERPRLADARPRMRENIAVALQIAADRVSIKATRPEGMGLSGDGAACIALAVLQEA